MLRWSRLRHGYEKESKQLESLISGVHEKKALVMTTFWIYRKTQ